MTRLLIVHHTPSPPLDAMHRAVREGADHPELAEVEVVARPALTASTVDVLEADGYVLGCPANLGTMAGALKHFFDTVYYPCLEATRNRPVGFYVHGGGDVDGAVSAIERILVGLAWRPVAPPVRVIGPPAAADLDACRELGSVVAASLL